MLSSIRNTSVVSLFPAPYSKRKQGSEAEFGSGASGREYHTEYIIRSIGMYGRNGNTIPYNTEV